MEYNWKNHIRAFFNINKINTSILSPGDTVKFKLSYQKKNLNYLKMNNYFKVLRPGINSTFQDLGRFGLQHLGIVASGCMDQLSFCNSNKLVGNKISEGALEFAYQGPLLEMKGENALVAISGKVNFNLIKKNGETIKGKSNESFLNF